MNEDSEDMLRRLDLVLEQCRVDGSGDLESLSRFLICEGRVPLVDRALAMLGHGAPVLCNMMSAVMVDTLTAVLPALVTGGTPPLPALRYLGSGRDCQGGSSSVHEQSSSDSKTASVLTNNAVASSISQPKLQTLLQHCERFCASERADESLVMLLVDCILKTAASVPSFRFEATTSLYRKDSRQVVGHSGVSSFTSFLDMVVSKRDRIYDKLSPCTRLYAWRLRPSLLEEDLVGLTKEASRRPLLSILSRPFEDANCRNFVLSLALAPDILADVRRRVHTWFLLSGAASVWNLRTGLMVAVADVVNQPSTWGLMGYAGAYVPLRFSLYSTYLQPWLRILKMPPTQFGLIQLVNMLDKAGAEVSDINRLGDSFATATHWKSLWSLQLDFLHWWKFALRILFSRCGGHLAQPDDVCDETARTWLKSRELAARYVCSVMNPTSRLVQQAGASELMKVADRWIQLWTPAHSLSCWDCAGLENNVVGPNPSVAYHAANVGLQTRKRGRAENSEEEVGKKMKVMNGSVGRPQILQRWFSDFCEACDVWDASHGMVNAGFRDNIISDVVADTEISMTKPCRFSDHLFKTVVSADPLLLEQDFGFVLLLFVAFGNCVEVDHNLCAEMGQQQGAWLDPDGSYLASSTKSRLCTKEPRHRTEGFTEAWPSRFWQQAAKVDLRSWVKGGAAIFDVLDCHDSSDASQEAAQSGVDGGKVAVLVLEFVHKLSSRLIESAQVTTLQDLRNRLVLWAQRRHMSALARAKYTHCLEKLDRSLLRVPAP